MTDVATYFEKLDLSSYVEIFVQNGFDMWDDVLDITESDLDFMGVKIGHRRRLQREIANYKGVSFESVIARTDRPPSSEPGQGGDSDGRQGRADGQIGATGKRRYRRHPKPDKNAPERPPSAYVLFSNQVREELKPQNLSFTEIAKVVGERWQQLDTNGREPVESEATAMKDEYNAKMAEYKKTDAYREYQEYLQAFKASQAQSAGSTGDGGKRLKLEKGGEGSHTSSRGSIGTPSTSAHGSPISLSSANMHAPVPDGVPSAISSPTSSTGFPAPYSHQLMAARTGGTPPARAPLLGHAPPLEPVSPFGAQPSILAPMATDPSRILPRRSNNQPAPYLQAHRDSNDTSTGSISSHYSSTSQASGAYTPITPVDTIYSAPRPSDGEHTPTYAQHSLNRLSIGSVGPQGAIAPPPPPPPVKPPVGYGGMHHHPPPPPPPPVGLGPDPVSRILPPPPPQHSGSFQPALSRPSLPPMPPLHQQQLPPARQPPQQQSSRMDGMSILALAGSLVDDEEGKDRKTKLP